MARRSDIDWEAIEREYRLGQKSNKQLAAEHRVQTSSIGRRAEKYGWAQDKAEEVRTRAANILVKATAAEVTGNAIGNATRNATPNEAEINVAARVAADVVLSHRKGLGMLGKLRDYMLDEIEAQTCERDMLTDIIEVARANSQDKGIAAKRDDLLARLLSLPSRVETLRRLTEIDERVRKGEREAFDITPDGGAGSGPPAVRIVVVPAKDDQ